VRVRIGIAAVLLCIALPTAAEDSVRVRYFGTYPRMDRSSESSEIEIARRPPVTPPGYPATFDQGVDRYFAAVSKALADASIESTNWERSVVDGNLVEVVIRIGAKQVRLASSFNPGAHLDSFPDSDGANERHRKALSAILKLTADRLQETIPR
jgi:hypothetical protein